MAINVAIMGNGPSHLLPELALYKEKIDIWIGADRGALTLINNQIDVTYALGDFDSINEEGNQLIKDVATYYVQHPIEKNQTDIEIAILKAIALNPDRIFLFGVTGGRLDHELINIQLLLSIIKRNIQGVIVDKDNCIEMTTPDSYIIEYNEHYPNISFVPFTKQVKGLTLTGFYYPLINKSISWGSTLCISNKLLANSGTYSYEEGILLLIKSRDASSHTIRL